MYQYDQYDQKMVDTRVEEFRDQVKRRIAGELTEDQFKPLRLMNGLYLQLHAYMLRVAIPYGTLSSKQMHMLAHIARKYDRDYGHFTTRQNLQFNWIKLADAPDILADLATVEMHAAIVSAISLLTSLPARPPTKLPTRAHGRSCCANGPVSTRNFPISPGNSSSR